MKKGWKVEVEETEKQMKSYWVMKTSNREPDATDMHWTVPHHSSVSVDRSLLLVEGNELQFFRHGWYLRVTQRERAYYSCLCFFAAEDLMHEHSDWLSWERSPRQLGFKLALDHSSYVDIVLRTSACICTAEENTHISTMSSAKVVSHYSTVSYCNRDS